MEGHQSMAHRLSTLTVYVGLLAAVGLSASPTLAQGNGVVDCLKGCRGSAQACNTPVSQARTTCAQGCRDTMKTTLQGCKTAPDPAACISSAFAAAETCHDGCKQTAEGGGGLCFDATNACIKQCTPSQGDCVVGCRETIRNCRQTASNAAYACRSSCRDTLVTTLEGCAATADPSACAKAARDAFKTCKTPCVDILKTAKDGCKTQAKSCKDTCAPPQ
jgi:hypothetical protein